MRAAQTDSSTINSAPLSQRKAGSGGPKNKNAGPKAGVSIAEGLLRLTYDGESRRQLRREPYQAARVPSAPAPPAAPSRSRRRHCHPGNRPNVRETRSLPTVVHEVDIPGPGARRRIEQEVVEVVRGVPIRRFQDDENIGVEVQLRRHGVNKRQSPTTGLPRIRRECPVETKEASGPVCIRRQARSLVLDLHSPVLGIAEPQGHAISLMAVLLFLDHARSSWSRSRSSSFTSVSASPDPSDGGHTQRRRRRWELDLPAPADDAPRPSTAAKIKTIFFMTRLEYRAPRDACMTGEANSAPRWRVGSVVARRSAPHGTLAGWQVRSGPEC